jgi:hypothetical protein
MFVGLPPGGISTGPPPERPRHGWVEAGLVLAIIGMLAGIFVILTGPSSNASAIVADAATSAIGDQTAHIQLTETVSVAGRSLTVSGSGAIDFTSGDLQADLTGSGFGESMDIMLVDVGDNYYVNIPQAAQYDGGKPWLSIDGASLGQSAANGVPGGGDNPAAVLQTLAQDGNDVTSIGTSTVDGQQVQGYAVTITSDAINKALDSASVPDWLRQAAQQVKVLSGSVTVYLSSAGDDLVRIGQAFSASAEGQTVNETLSIDFSDYGASVSISPPPADQVESYQDFAQAVAAAG